MKWLIFLKLIFEIFIKISLVVLGMMIIIYAFNISKLWSRFDIFIFLAGVSGVLLIIAVIKLDRIIHITRRFPKRIKIAGFVLFFIGLVSFIIVQIFILSNMRGKPPVNEVDYVIVLGCQVVGIYPSFPLVRRINTSSVFLNEHSDVKAIASGGQGPGEDITEAEVIRRYLIENGVNRDRILMEDKSRNTLENLKFSDELYDLTDKNILIVTTDYHMFRSMTVARKLGYKNVSGLPSRSQRSVLPIYLLREYASVMLYALMGRI
ncbi:MAG: YdcF family protein [Treponema sp.]|nr:YdcF family protein [Treponema sp.]